MTVGWSEPAGRRRAQHGSRRTLPPRARRGPVAVCGVCCRLSGVDADLRQVPCGQACSSRVRSATSISSWPSPTHRLTQTSIRLAELYSVAVTCCRSWSLNTAGQLSGSPRAGCPGTADRRRTVVADRQQPVADDGLRPPSIEDQRPRLAQRRARLRAGRGHMRRGGCHVHLGAARPPRHPHMDDKDAMASSGGEHPSRVLHGGRAMAANRARRGGPAALRASPPPAVLRLIRQRRARDRSVAGPAEVLGELAFGLKGGRRCSPAGRPVRSPTTATSSSCCRTVGWPSPSLGAVRAAGLGRARSTGSAAPASDYWVDHGRTGDGGVAAGAAGVRGYGRRRPRASHQASWP
jgi:hypothetical protein